MANPTYQVIVQEPTTGINWEIIPKSYKFTERLNKETTAEFTLSFEEMQKMAAANDTTILNIFTAALREIYITRDSLKIFFGVVTDFDVEPGGQGDMNVTVKAMGHFGLFKKRIVGIGTQEYHDNQDAGNLAWTLIENSQASDPPYSDWGIQQGSIDASKDRDRGYLFDNIYDSIVRLSNDNLADGFDFDIDTNKFFNVYYPKRGVSRPNIVFDIRTMASWRYKKQLYSNMANKVYVLGEGFNDDILYTTRTAAISYRSPFGTLEEKLDARDVSELATLQDKGDRRIAEAREPRTELSNVSHYDNEILYSDYNVGDIIVVNLPQLALSNVEKRIRERTFTMQSPQSIGLCSLVLE